MEEQTAPEQPARIADGSSAHPHGAPRKARGLRIAGIVVAAVLVIGGVGALVGHTVWMSTKRVSSSISGSTPLTVPAPSQVTPGFAYQGPTGSGAPANAASVAEATDPAMVDVDVTLPYQAGGAAGTGMVLTSNGEILTNNHVIEGAGTVTVVDVGNGRTYTATVTGYDHMHDVAVLRLDHASGLKTVDLGDSSKVTTGEGVVALGNADGTGGTPTSAGGSVTAIDQSITAEDQASGASEALSGLIETNATIISGDSGGALVNSSGQVIGMITAGTEGFGSQQTQIESFAIPINQAVGIADQIEAGRSSSTVHIGATPFLGVEAVSPTNGAAGAEIAKVIPGGAADKAGLAEGDVITSLAGQPVTSPAGLTDALLSQSPTASVSVLYLDPSGRQHAATVHLASGPPQ